MTEAILVLNVGSSSVKFAVYAASDPPSLILRGKLAGIGTDPVFSAQDAAGQISPPDIFPQFDHAAGLGDIIPDLLRWIEAHRGDLTIRAAGHSVVHGGRHHMGPALVTDALLAELEALVPLAPLHQPHNLAAIRCLAASAPDLAQVACFDTSFHRTQDRLAQLFAIPRALSDEGILRYGFHGLSYDFIAGTLAGHVGANADERVIVAHLGNGASMCAMRDRRSVATSMGFTALDGLMMGRRCGALDPGVVLYLMQEKGLTAGDITSLLYEQSGLLGVSCISSDMATLQASDAPEAQLAVDLFCYRAAAELAALAASIGGLDILVFTAGIGENSAIVRTHICERLRWMGITLDPAANEDHATCVGMSGSEVEVLVIPTDEEIVIARSTLMMAAA
ncbi:acetate kinase [Meridianimarinicoccus roseus]|uniref:Acetate kinase n=1 Tax=Meridianimarinicoccus roseus TaxID=2072018 RepID=A0A2V2LC16_9RHOB|nr:acetate/propionate family kinase [Meridianimarinicoccus roseus]PWR01281.1 acetate kinase [Meridianimarinicoccus roseus]